MSAETSIRVAPAVRPPILDAIDPARHAVIEASAGTGKTFTLEHLVVEIMLRRGIPLDRILLVTFTDKATRQMRARLRETVSRVHRAATLLGSDREGSSLEAGAEAWHVDAAGTARLAEAIATFDAAPISTIHAFCHRILTERAFDCARLLRQEQVDSRDAFRGAFNQELRARLANARGGVLERAIEGHGVARLEEAMYRWFVEPAPPSPPFDAASVRAALVRFPIRVELAPGGLATRALESALSAQPKKRIVPILRELAPAIETLRAGGSLSDALDALWAWAKEPATSAHEKLAYLRHHVGRARGLESFAGFGRARGPDRGEPVHGVVAPNAPRDRGAAERAQTGARSARLRRHARVAPRRLARTRVGAARARSPSSLRGGPGRRVSGHRRDPVGDLSAHLRRRRGTGRSRRRAAHADRDRRIRSRRSTVFETPTFTPITRPSRSCAGAAASTSRSR